MDTKTPTQQLVNYGVKAVLLVGAVYGISKLLQQHATITTEHEVETKPEVSQAMNLYSAMNPSGMEWLKKTDGTSTDAIFTVAKAISNLNAVQDAYQKLYRSSLLADLRQELSTEDYTKFLNILKFSSNNTSTGTRNTTSAFVKGTLLITKLPANLRKTPSNVSRWSLDSNIIQLATAGKFVGFATGQNQFDTSGASNAGTLFIGVQSAAIDTKKPIRFWVAASQLQPITQAEYKANKYPFVALHQNQVLNGISSNTAQVIALTIAPLLDRTFRQIGTTYPLQPLGYALMELNDNKGNEYIKFITNTQQQHWVNKKYVQLI